MVWKALREGLGLSGMELPSSHWSGFLKGGGKDLVFYACSYLNRALGGTESPAGDSKLF